MKDFRKLYLEVAQFRKKDKTFEKTVTGNKEVFSGPGSAALDKKAKDKSRKADKDNAAIKEGINGEWTKEQHRRLEEKEKSKKKVYGDFRTSLGKANRANIKESVEDVKSYYSSSIFDVLSEIDTLTNELLDNNAYVDWKHVYRCLEDCKDSLLTNIPNIDSAGVDAVPTEDADQ